MRHIVLQSSFKAFARLFGAGHSVRPQTLAHARTHGAWCFYVLAAILGVGLLICGSLPASADPYPPYWGDGTGPAVHYPPVAWPNEPADPSNCRSIGTCGAWKPYTRFGVPITDARVQDSSNGGTSPQNYVNVTSGCVDQSLPSVYTAFDPASNTLFFRWRVEQAANTYATGPAAGTFGSSDPWSSALWTVFFDLSGSGYRDLAAHLDGSSGNPGMAVDQIAGIWADSPNSQSLDYTSDPAIHLLSRNPTAFVDQATSRILNFQDGLNPSPNWPNGSSETTWNYGTTRARRITRSGTGGATCDEYFVDYQIPLKMLDASSMGGPRVTGDTPLSMLFCTANGLNNPLQKDCVYLGAWTSDPSQPAPFGDFFTPKGGTIQQPLVDSIAAAACGPAELTVKTKDALKLKSGRAETAITNADFYYYHDANGDGRPNDGNDWTLAAPGSQAGLNRWTASWDSSSLPRGQYLIGAQVANDAALNADRAAHRTFSYLSSDQVALLPPTPGELSYANLDPHPGIVYATMVNTCGARPPYLTQSLSTATTAAGSQLQITVTVHNTGPSALPISSISDILPPNFSYAGTTSQSLGVLSGSPTVGATGTIRWTFTEADVPAGGTRELAFAVDAPAISGIYNNDMTAASPGAGTLTGDPIQISVGAPRLSLAHSAGVITAEPGDQVVERITFSNESTIDVTGVTVQEALPVGFVYDSADGNPGYDDGNRTLTWNLGTLAAGKGPFSLAITGTIASPFSPLTPNPLVSTATIQSDQTGASSGNATIYVNMPRPVLRIQVSADKPQVMPGSTLIYTLSYENVGDAPATNVVIDDPIPSGFTFASATAGGTDTGGTVHWAIGTVAAGASGSVQLTLNVSSPYTSANPQTNTVSIGAAEGASAADSFATGVTQSGDVCATYYFHNSTTDVGFDDSQKTADTSTPAGAGASVSITTLLNQQYSEVARFYQDPAAATDLSFSQASIDTRFYIDRQNGNGITIRATVYDYDSPTGAKTLLGQDESSFQGSMKGLYSFSVTADGTLRRGHRLLWVFEVRGNNSNGTDTIQFQFDGTVTNQFSGGTASATSSGRFCTTAPANPVLQTQASAQQTQPNGDLLFWMDIANTGGTNATSTVLTDTLPAGVTFVEATLDGGAIAPTSIVGRQYAFSIQSSGQPAGIMGAGTSARLAIRATVDRPLDDGIASLVNNASLACDQTNVVSDSVTVDVVRPGLSISTAASRTALAPGDTVTYTVMVLNSGSGPATGVTINDVLPATDYYTYRPGSATLNGVSVPGPSGNDLSVAVGSLGPGGTAVVTYQMQVASSGVPDGLTTLESAATVSSLEDSDSISSQTVAVTVIANPDLALAISANPASPWPAGSLITYTLVVRNTGGAAATKVLVADPVPANTSYVLGTMQVDGVSQTDDDDMDAGAFDAINNRVTFSFATLPTGSASTLRFVLKINTPLANGLTPVSSVATVNAANAATRSADAGGQATASPDLSLSTRGPANVAYPAARLASAVNDSAVLQVDDATQLSIGEHVLINGVARQIVGVDEHSITVDAPFTAGSGASVIGSIVYSVAYANSGSAGASGVALVDTLPAGATFVSATGGGVYDAGAVTWNLDAVPAGASGVLQLTIFPAGPGSAANSATLTSVEVTPLIQSVSTTAGGLRISKSTKTSSVQQTLAGTSATYVVQVDSTAGITATGVTVRDILPNGATYVGGSATFGGNATRTGVDDPDGDMGQPTWGTWSIPPDGSLTITFDAHFGAEAGPGSYSNFAEGNSSNLPVISFDGLVTGAEDVRVTEPVVALISTVSEPTVRAGGRVQYTLAATNSGDAAATSVQITDTLPAGFAYSDTIRIETGGSAVRTSTESPDIGAETPGWGTWSIAPGGAVTITFSASASSTPGTHTHSVTATAGNTLIPSLSGVVPVNVTAVDEAPRLIAASPNPIGLIDAAYPVYTFLASGYPPPTYTVSAGSLPPGLHLDADSGELSGMPSATGSFGFAVRAANRAGYDESSPITITIDMAPNHFSAETPSDGTIGRPYSYQFQANGSPAPTYVLASGELPDGLELSADGFLDGTPTATGTFTFTVKAVNRAGEKESDPATIDVIASGPHQVMLPFIARTEAASSLNHHMLLPLFWSSGQ